MSVVVLLVAALLCSPGLADASSEEGHPCFDIPYPDVFGCLKCALDPECIIRETPAEVDE